MNSKSNEMSLIDRLESRSPSDRGSGQNIYFEAVDELRKLSAEVSGYKKALVRVFEITNQREPNNDDIRIVIDRALKEPVRELFDGTKDALAKITV